MVGVCNLCSIGSFLGIVLLLILVVIGLQIIQFLYRVNVIAKRIEQLTDYKTWLSLIKWPFFKSK